MLQQLEFLPDAALSHSVHGKYDVAVTPKVSEMLSNGCCVGVGVSGGKDSVAAALRLAEYKDILSVTGVRHQESASRAKMPIASQQEKLTRKGSEGINWNPIIEWTTDEVFEYIRAKNGPLHEAYTRYTSTRVSCSFCIMGSIGDLNASASCPDNHDTYRRMVKLEIQSGFGLQGGRWLGDVAPHILDEDSRNALATAKVLAKKREAAEARIPKHLLFTNGWPDCVPTREEAQLLAEVRTIVFNAIGVAPTYITPASIIERYKALAAEKTKAVR